MVIQLADDLIDIDGLKVYRKKGDTNWFACNGKRIGSIRMQKLYLYLYNKEKVEIKRFDKYVDNLIDKLIYN